MGIVFRQSIKTSAVIIAGAVLGVVFIFWQTKVMPKVEIGIFRNLINQAAVLQSFLLLGIPSLLFTYIHRFPEGDPRRNTILGTALIVPLLLWGIFCIPYFLLRHWIISKFQLIDQPYMNQIFIWLPVFTLLWCYMVLLEFYLISFMKAAVATFMREVVLRGVNILILALFAFGYITFKSFVICSVLAYMVPVGMLAIVLRKASSDRIRFNWKVFTKQETRDVVHYTWYHTLIGVSITVVGFIDSLMLAPLDKDGSSSLAVYGIVVFLISFVNIPYKAMMTSAFPKLNQIYIGGDRVQLLDFFNRTNLNILVATVFIGILMLCNLHNAVALLPDGYGALAPLFTILFLGRIIDVSTGLNQEFIGITPHYKFTFYASLVYILVAVTCNRIFIPVYGIYGAAWVSVAAVAVFNIIKAVFLKWKFGVMPFEKKGLWIFPIAGLAYGVSWLIPQLPNPVLDGLVRTPVVAIVMICLIFWLQPSPDVKEYWLSVKKNKRLY